jgi:steroid 5-alpha reductase family enzyme
VAVTIIFLLSQGIRAYWEEQKFLQVTPDYRAFMVVTGAYWPRFRKSVRTG